MQRKRLCRWNINESVNSSSAHPTPPFKNEKVINSFNFNISVSHVFFFHIKIFIIIRLSQSKQYFNTSKIMLLSIPPVPIPASAGSPGTFVQVLCPGGGAFVHLRTTSREVDKTVKSPVRQVACFIPSRSRLAWKKIWILCHSGWSAKDWTSLLRFLEVSLLILENFPVLYSDNYLSYIIYRKIKETNAAIKIKMHFAFIERGVYFICPHPREYANFV